MFFKLYFIALPIFFVLDMIWLGLIAKGFYFKALGTLMRTDINWTAGIIFYLLFVVGLVIFVISPAVEKGSWHYALIYGALFGFFTYATYDLTNLATLKDWPLLVSLVDMAWGAVLAGAISISTFFIVS